jgi:hypothetical protein
MSLRDLLREGHLRPQETSVQEVTDLLEVADRALHDAGVPQLSPDGKYITTYNAALALATVVVRASGYRVSGSAHHWAAFAALPELLGATAQGRADQFDRSRRKRNRATYSRAGQISEEEAAKILAAVQAFRSEVLDWLRANHPELLPQE